MKILILGGTGAMGTHLVELLAHDNNDLFVTTRSNKKSVEKVHYIQGNAHDLNFLKSNLQAHWDAIVDFMVYNTEEFKERANFLLEATSQYIFLSSSRVYANSKIPLKEDSPRLLDAINDEDYLKTDEYALSKARQENVLYDSGCKNWTIIRPYITYSEKRLQLGVLEKEAWLYRALHGRTIVFSKDINEKITTLTYGLDVSNGISSIIGNSTAFGEVFHITKQTSIEWKSVLNLYLQVLETHLGFRPKVIFSDLNTFMKFHTEEYQVKYDRLFNRKFDVSKISQFVDVNEFINTETGLKNCLESFINNPYFKNINWVSEAKKDKIAKERTSLNEIQNFKQKIKYILYRYFI
ncbi:MAG: epimerase [Treponema sp. CETP13]|nr:MAG: epimerase [Treponema sp. CETP13]